MSDEEDNAKENGNDSDENFNIDNYASYNKFLELTAESSIRKRLRKRERDETITQIDLFDENNEDGSITKDSENLSKFSANENRIMNHDTINISDDEDSRNVRREPSRFEPSMEPKQIER